MDKKVVIVEDNMGLIQKLSEATKEPVVMVGAEFRGRKVTGYAEDQEMNMEYLKKMASTYRPGPTTGYTEEKTEKYSKKRQELVIDNYDSAFNKARRAKLKINSESEALKRLRTKRNKKNRAQKKARLKNRK